MSRFFLSLTVVLACVPAAAAADMQAFLAKHCFDCHDADTHKGNLDLTALKPDFAQAESFARWMKVHDRIAAGEMPPKKRPRPPAVAVRAVTAALADHLIKAERIRLDAANRTHVRRLTRAEYENTVRDLFDMPGIALQGLLPPDGSAHGFDKNSEALDISHVNLASYVEAADHTLNLAIATRPTAPRVQKTRCSLASAYIIQHVITFGDGVLLKNKKLDPDFPPAGKHVHIAQEAHKMLGSFSNGASVGIFRHEDCAFVPYFMDHVTLYPGLYRVRASLWSFQWDKGKVLPARGTEAVRLSVVQLTGDGTGSDHPSYALGYFGAPSLKEREHELITWLNVNEIIGLNAASLVPSASANDVRKGHALGFTGPGIACDWLDVEGPLHKVWPPVAHQRLFGALPLTEFKAAEHPGVRPPKRWHVRQIGELDAVKNRPDPVAGLWTVASAQPLVDADRLLAAFLPRAFRRPVDAAFRKAYVAKVEKRLKAGDCFETALRWAYRAALCSPDFLYHIEPADKLDDYALAARLSYLLWNSLPDDELTALAAAGKLQDKKVRHEQVERLLKNPKAQRFVDDFLGQWLKLRLIAATDPDHTLYPEFSPYLQDSMVAETRAYFRELLERNLDARYLVKSDFAMLNEKLATHYGIGGVSGSQMRRVSLPADCPRGPFLTQAAILKITANGTTTSPVPRGAFVMDRLLGRPPEPPPSNVPAVEPDVRGALTIREQLAKHRTNAVCASCHAKIDPPGFALESFDVIGGFRTRYRSIGKGDPAPRGLLDPFIGIYFKLGLAVDASGQMPDGRSFSGINEFQTLLATEPHPLLHNLARQLTTYATGRAVVFSDRTALNDMVARTEKQGGGLRTLLHELVDSQLFQAR